MGYAYADSVTSHVNKYVRLSTVTYAGPSGGRKVIHYNYGSGAGEKLSRLHSVSSSAGGGTVYAQYTYIGAGDVVKAVAAVAGGSGGGRPEMAQAGGKDPAKIDEALAVVANLVK